MDTSSCKMTLEEANHTSGGARNELLEKAFAGHRTGCRQRTCCFGAYPETPAGGGSRTSADACPAAHGAAGAGLRHSCRRF